MKRFTILAASFFSAFTLFSCAPDPTGTDIPTTLDPNKVGGTMHQASDVNTYNYALSCGCPFELKSENADTTSIQYAFGTMGTSARSHIIKATPRAGLTSGTYTGWVALVTLKPDTNPDLRDTMRDTVIIP